MAMQKYRAMENVAIPAGELLSLPAAEIDVRLKIDLVTYEGKGTKKTGPVRTARTVNRNVLKAGTIFETTSAMKGERVQLQKETPAE